MKQNRLAKVIEFLKKPSDRRLGSFDNLDSEIRSLTNRVQRKVNAKSLEGVNEAISKFQKSIDLKPLQEAIEALKGETGGIYKELASRIENQLEDLVGRMDEGLERLGRSEEGYTTVSKEISSIREGGATKLDVAGMAREHSKLVKEFETATDLMETMIADVQESLSIANKNIGGVSDSSKEQIKKLSEALDELRRDLLSRIAGHSGGNANRNIAISGNTSVLSTYTDINLKPGNGVTITYANNNTTKYTDITITATGSGSGITREINRIAVSSTIGSVVGIDYVTICTAGIQATLPTAVNNDNLYTIKNVSASSVLVGTTSGQTIDGDSTIILATQYTSVDIINDGNDNWSIT